MFGCKYVSQIMELLGSEVAKEKGIQGLLDKLHDMELVLPDWMKYVSILCATLKTMCNEANNNNEVVHGWW